MGLGTLEPPHAIRVRMRALVHRLVARFVQHTGHGRSTGRQRGTTQQQVADPLAAPLRMLLLEHQDRPLGQLRQAAAGRSPTRLVHQPGRPLLVEKLPPFVERRRRGPHQRRKILGGQSAAPPSIQQQQPLLGRERVPLGVFGQTQLPSLRRPPRATRRRQRGAEAEHVVIRWRIFFRIFVVGQFRALRTPGTAGLRQHLFRFRRLDPPCSRRLRRDPITP